MSRYFALVAAAGCGNRAQTLLPKQYVSIHGYPVLHHTIQVLFDQTRIERIFVILSRDDQYFHTFDWSQFSERLTPLWCGGSTRQESVMNGLSAVRNLCHGDDWILVHDAARPLLRSNTLDKLLNQLNQDSIGGILAVPVRDTIKKAAKTNVSAPHTSHIEHTIDRTALWHAQTPQMFRYHLLYNALMQDGNFSDEASAVEAMGYSPKLILGDHSNIKITYPEDFQMAKALLYTADGYFNRQPTEDL